MGIIFRKDAERLQVKDLLDTENEWMLNRLQAGRDGDMSKGGFGTTPHRLSREELEKLKDEFIYVNEHNEELDICFEKPVSEIRLLLGLEEQEDPFTLTFDVPEN